MKHSFLLLHYPVMFNAHKLNIACTSIARIAKWETNLGDKEIFAFYGKLLFDLRNFILVKLGPSFCKFYLFLYE